MGIFKISMAMLKPVVVKAEKGGRAKSVQTSVRTSPCLPLTICGSAVISIALFEPVTRING